MVKAENNFEEHFEKGFTKDTESPILTCKHCGVEINDFVEAISKHIFKCHGFPLNRRITVDVSKHPANGCINALFTSPSVGIVKGSKCNVVVVAFIDKP